MVHPDKCDESEIDFIASQGSSAFVNLHSAYTIVAGLVREPGVNAERVAVEEAEETARATMESEVSEATDSYNLVGGGDRAKLFRGTYVRIIDEDPVRGLNQRNVYNGR